MVPAPKHALKQGGIAERALTKRYAQAVRSTGPSQPFLASEAGREFYSDRNPPPHDFVPDGPEAARALNRRLHPMKDQLPGDLGPPELDHTDHGGVPAFLNRRNGNGNADAAEPTFVDLVGGDR